MKSRPHRLRVALLTLAPVAVFLAVFGWLTYAHIRQERLNEKLIAAVQREDLPATLSLLNRGASPNARWKPAQEHSVWRDLWETLRKRGGRRQKYRYPTALMLAAERGNSRLVRLLLDRGAQVNATHAGDSASLDYASMCGHPDTVRLLLDRGADMNARIGDHYTVLTLMRSLETPRPNEARGRSFSSTLVMLKMVDGYECELSSKSVDSVLWILEQHGAKE